MGLSPSTLFHFTSKKSGLKGILSDNFKIKYCLEKLTHRTNPISLAIPMVSFCDIKISEIVEHIEKYGSYGIGLSKDWAIKKGLNPVIYLNSSSDFATKLIDDILESNKDTNITLEKKINNVDILRYSKVYEGPLTRKEKTIKSYRFADEREWRYVPPYSNSFLPWATNRQYDSDEKKQKLNDKLRNERLTFDANQILYIIVKKDSEIDEIINHIRNVKGVTYTMQEVDRLTTRILSCERIMKDF